MTVTIRFGMFSGLTASLVSLSETAFYSMLRGRPRVGLPAPSANARILVSRNKREGRYGGRLQRKVARDYHYFGKGLHQRTKVARDALSYNWSKE